jgi:hypothetical protein
MKKEKKTELINKKKLKTFFFDPQVKKLWFNRLRVDRFFIPFGLTIYFAEIIFSLVVVFTRNGDVIQFLKSILQMFFFISLILLFYFLTFKITKKMNFVLDSLEENMSDQKSKEFEKYSLRILTHPIVSLVSIFATLAFIIPYVFFHLTGDEWWSSLGVWTGVYDQVLDMIFLPMDIIQICLIFTALVVLFTRVLCFFIILTKMKIHVDKINLYHEDGGAGLSKIGDFVFYLMRNSVYLLVLGISFALSWNYIVDETRIIWIGATVYALIPLILVLLIFVFPLNSIHKIIVKEKEKRKKRLSVLLKDIDLYILREEKIYENKEMIENLKALEIFNRVIDNIPNWPFNMEQIVKIILAAFTPLFTILLTIFIEYLITL